VGKELHLDGTNEVNFIAAKHSLVLKRFYWVRQVIVGGKVGASSSTNVSWKNLTS